MKRVPIIIVVDLAYDFAEVLSSLAEFGFEEIQRRESLGVLKGTIPEENMQKAWDNKYVLYVTTHQAMPECD